MQGPNLRNVTWIFLRVGNTTVGGGEPTVAGLQRELSQRGWLSPGQFGLSYALARITPGTNMLAFCAAAGWYALGLAGAVAAVLAVTIPSSALVVVLTRICAAGDTVPWLGSAVRGSIAAAVGIMVSAALRLARSQAGSLTGVRRWLMPVIVPSGAFVLRLAGLSPLQILVVAALVGLFWRTA